MIPISPGPVGTRTCPGNFTHVAKGNKCLQLLERKISTSHFFNQAKDECQQEGGKLVTIKNQVEDAGVFGMFVTRTIGLCCFTHLAKFCILYSKKVQIFMSVFYILLIFETFHVVPW